MAYWEETAVARRQVIHYIIHLDIFMETSNSHNSLKELVYLSGEVQGDTDYQAMVAHCMKSDWALLLGDTPLTHQIVKALFIIGQ